MTEERFLERKIALVTGASSGSGVDIAQALARRGARVAVHYRSSRTGAEGVVAAIRAAGAEAQAFQADVAVADDVRRLVGEVEAALGPVSVLVNNAGPFADTAFRTLTERDWDYVMSANLKSVFLARPSACCPVWRSSAGVASSTWARRRGSSGRTLSTASPRPPCCT